MSDNLLPQARTPQLIVVIAFDRNEEGEFVPVFGPQDFQTAERAVRVAKALATKHAGVIAWSREARPDVGEYGDPTTLFTAGDVPDMG